VTGWPYDGGRPIRCSRCGTAPAIKLQDRPAGPWCRSCLPWSPVAPGWGVGRCRRCTDRGGLHVDTLGRISGPWCRTHRPRPVPFTEAANVAVADALDRLAGGRR
jgi:hypothetical protein